MIELTSEYVAGRRTFEELKAAGSADLPAILNSLKRITTLPSMFNYSDLEYVSSVIRAQPLTDGLITELKDICLKGLLRARGSGPKYAYEVLGENLLKLQEDVELAVHCENAARNWVNLGFRATGALIDDMPLERLPSLPDTIDW